MPSIPYLADLLQVSDSSFPTGSFVHSAGLESLAPAGAAALETLIAVRLRETVARVDLVFLLASYTRPWLELDDLFDAMVLPREVRQASRQVGRQCLRNACDLFDEPRLTGFAAGAIFCHLPVVFGSVCATRGVPNLVAAETFALGQVRGLIGAAQRLMRLGQRDAQRILHALKPRVAEAVELARAIPLADAGGFAPLWDIAAMSHERAPVRLFVS